MGTTPSKSSSSSSSSSSRRTPSTIDKSIDPDEFKKAMEHYFKTTNKPGQTPFITSANLEPILTSIFKNLDQDTHSSYKEAFIKGVEDTIEHTEFGADVIKGLDRLVLSVGKDEDEFNQKVKKALQNWYAPMTVDAFTQIADGRYSEYEEALKDSLRKLVPSAGVLSDEDFKSNVEDALSDIYLEMTVGAISELANGNAQRPESDLKIALKDALKTILSDVFANKVEGFANSNSNDNTTNVVGFSKSTFAAWN